jgi:hypothetical protein
MGLKRTERWGKVISVVFEEDTNCLIVEKEFVVCDYPSMHFLMDVFRRTAKNSSSWNLVGPLHVVTPSAAHIVQATQN